MTTRRTLEMEVDNYLRDVQEENCSSLSIWGVSFHQNISMQSWSLQQGYWSPVSNCVCACDGCSTHSSIGCPLRKSLFIQKRDHDGSKKSNFARTDGSITSPQVFCLEWTGTEFYCRHGVEWWAQGVGESWYALAADPRGHQFFYLDATR